jgi:hypothetical protein
LVSLPPGKARLRRRLIVSRPRQSKNATFPDGVPVQTGTIENVLDDLERRIREVALSLPETYEDEPWGHPVFKVGDNRMFASMSAGDAAVHLTVKLTAEEREIAQLLPYVRKG